MKIIKGFVALLISLNIMLGASVMAAPAPAVGTTCYVDVKVSCVSSSTGKIYKAGDAIKYMTVRNNGTVCYCIEPGVGFTRTFYRVSKPTDNSTWLKMSATVRESVALTAMFGFPSCTAAQLGVASNHDAYAATQAIIWEYIIGERTDPSQAMGKRGQGLKGTPAETAYWNILSKIKAYKSDKRYTATAETSTELFVLTTASASTEQGLLYYTGKPPEYVESKGSIAVYKTGSDARKLAGAYFKVTNVADRNQSYILGPTNADGYASLGDVVYGTYEVVETVFPNGYYAGDYRTSWTVVLDDSAPNGTVVINAVNEQIPGNCKIIKTSEDGQVDGINFTVTGNGINKTVTTANGGQIIVEGLKPGVYTVAEEVIDKYEPQDSRKVTVVSGQTATVDFSNSLKRGSLTVTKTSEDELAEGMRFRLTGISYSGIEVDEYAVTNANGIAAFNDILIGKNYTLSEVDTPSRYVIPETQNVAVEWNTVTSTSVKNILKKWCAEIYKSDSHFSDLGEAVYGKAQGDATLEGAVYGLYENGILADTYTTDKNGYFSTKCYPCAVNGKDAEYYLQEISSSKGYLLDPTKYYIDTASEKFTAEYNTEYVNVYETVISGKIAIIKHSDDGSTQIENPEENAVFEVYLKSAGSYDNARQTERALLTTDKYGFAETPDYLPYGVYVVKQIKGLEGKELIPAFTVNINENGKIYRYLINNAAVKAKIEIVKKDNETGKIIPVAGIGFKVRNTDTGEYVIQHINYPVPMDIEIYYTNDSGKLMLPYDLPYGNYEIIEQNTCYGYVLDGTPVPFKVDGSADIVTVVKSNIAQKGTVIITKSGEVFSSVTVKDGIYRPVYEVKSLQGAVYEIIALEDIITPDGTVRCTKGQIVDTVTTGKDGTAASKPLYLGKYRCKEITAPHCMVINKKPVDIELVYAGELIEITSITASFVNERQKIKVGLKKAMENDDIFNIGSNGEITNVKFGLYANKDMIAADGKIIPKDALLETAYCGKDGNIIFAADLPVGASVYVKEIRTDCHYILTEDSFQVDFDYAGQETKTVHITVNNGAEIKNEILRGSVLGRKIDEDGFAICGALFGLFRADEKEFTEETAILTCKSNDNGVFLFENVPYGKYIVREIKAAPAFILNESNYGVVIDEKEKTIELVIENKFKVGSVKTVKVDKEHPENTLSGAVFEIYSDVDSNKEFDAKIDCLVGEMAEGENGFYTMENLCYGGYFLYEKTAPEGFLRDDGYYYFEIRENGVTVTVENEAGVGFVNEAKKGNVKIIKKDSDSGDLLSGVEFGLYDLQGKEIAKGVTDDNGELLFENIRLGKYELKELTQKDGYYKNEDIIPVEITEHGKTCTFEVTNKKIPPEPKSPKTGDSSNISLWFTGMCLSLLAGIGLGVYNRKEKN